MVINFLKYRKIYYIFSAILILGSIVSLVFFGLKPGIDFTGGSILEIEFKNSRPEIKIIKEALSDLDLGEIFIQPTQEKGMILKMKDISEQTHQEILEKLKKIGELKEKRFESIGPVIGKELKEKTKIAFLLSMLAISFYITLSFRKTQRIVSSWQYAFLVLLALFHDVLIPLGIFAILGKFYGIEITIPVVVALLAVAGYSINDTIVVFDRIRENLLRKSSFDFEEIVNNALNQTLTRSLNTSLTTLFPLFALFFFGGETLRYFSLTLIIGILAGTYCSIFLVSPILVTWFKWRK